MFVCCGFGDTNALLQVLRQADMYCGRRMLVFFAKLILFARLDGVLFGTVVLCRPV